MSNIERMRATWDSARQKEAAAIDPRTIAKIRDLTNRNMVEAASAEVAKILGMTRLVKQLQLIDQLGAAFGHTPTELVDLRYRISKPMYDKARQVPLPGGGTLNDLL